MSVGDSRVIFSNWFGKSVGVCEKIYIGMSDKCNFSGKNNNVVQIIQSMNQFRHVKIGKSEAIKIDKIQRTHESNQGFSKWLLIRFKSE